MKSVSTPTMDPTSEIIAELYTALEAIGAPPHLLGIINSWGDTQNDEETLRDLKHWNASGK